MTPTVPNVSPDGRYSIKETCEILGIHPNTLYYHTNKHNIKYGVRKTNMRRFYTGRDILNFWHREL